MAISRDIKNPRNCDVQHGLSGSRRDVAEIRLHGPYGPDSEDSMIVATVFDHNHKSTTLRLSISAAIDLRDGLNALINSRYTEADLARAIQSLKKDK